MMACRMQQAINCGNRRANAAFSTVITQRTCSVARAGRRSIAPQAAAGGVAQAAVPSVLSLQPAHAFTAGTVLVLPVYFAMIAFPSSKATRQLVRSPFIPLLLGIPYAIILWQAWQQGTLQALAAAVQSSSPFPDPAALANVFTQPTLTAMAWLHLLLLDLLQARGVLLDGLKQMVPTGHSVALCCMFGPLGVLSHIITRWAVHKARGGKARLAPFA